jgi:hypothetical protein
MPLAAKISDILTSNNRSLVNLIFWPTLVLLIFINARSLYISFDAYSPIDRQGNPHCYDTDFCNVTGVVNELAAPGDRVLVLHASRYYLRTDLFACSSTIEDYQILRDFSYQDQNKFWEAVYRLGYKYNLPAWLTLIPIHGNLPAEGIAYKIVATNPPTEVETICRKNNQGLWEAKTRYP